MIELSTSSLKPTAPTPGSILPGVATGGFMETLAAFLDSAAGGSPTVRTAAGSPDDRQTLADDGKTLPDKGDANAHDPALIWLQVPLALQLPTIRPVALTSGGGQAQDDAGSILPGSPAKTRVPLGDPREVAPTSVDAAMGLPDSPAKTRLPLGNRREVAPASLDTGTILPGSPAKTRVALGDLREVAPASTDAGTSLPDSQAKTRFPLLVLHEGVPASTDAGASLPDSPAKSRVPLGVPREGVPASTGAGTIPPGSPAKSQVPLGDRRDGVPASTGVDTILPGSPAKTQAALGDRRDGVPASTDTVTSLPYSPAKSRVPPGAVREGVPASIDAVTSLPAPPAKSGVPLGGPRDGVPASTDAVTSLPDSPAKSRVPLGVPREGVPASISAGTVLPGFPAKAGAPLGDLREAAPATVGVQAGGPAPAQTTVASAATDATGVQSAAAVDASTRETRRTTPPASVELAPSPTVARTAQPAGQVFAAAIAAASGNPQRPARENARAEPGAATIVTAGQIDVAHRPVVQPISEAPHAPLDLRGDRGLQGMIDRIELLRDDVNARDTRIRLMPDALGNIDLSVRKDGDAVHVHFTAENQATRTLLTEAQPRLAELAEARGVKLGGATVDAGTGGGANHQPRFEPARAPAPSPATAVAADSEKPNDQRLA